MPDALVNATVTVSELLGAETMLYTTIGSQEFIAKVGVNTAYTTNQKVELAFNINKAHFFDVETQDVIRKQKVAEALEATI